MTLSPDQNARAKERSMMAGVLMDGGIIGVMVIVGISSGSLTLLSECVRAILLLLIEVMALIVLRRKNRLQLTGYDFGTGKIERFVNMAIAAGLVFGGLWLMQAAYGRIGGGAIGSPVGLTLAALVGEANLLLNIWAFVLVWRQSRDGTSLVMTSYCRARLVKLVASVIVQAALVISARAADPEVGDLADGLGCAFVAMFMMWIGYGMLRAGLPDVLDRTLDEARQVQINRVLTRHFNAFDSLISVGSRRAGNAYHIKIRLGFFPGTTIGDIGQRTKRIADDLALLIPGALISVIAGSIEAGRAARPRTSR